MDLRIQRQLLDLVLLRPRIGVDDKLLDLLLLALLLVEDLRRRTVQNRRRLTNRNIRDDPRCHLLEILVVLLIVAVILLELVRIVLHVFRIQ